MCHSMMGLTRRYKTVVFLHFIDDRNDTESAYIVYSKCNWLYCCEVKKVVVSRIAKAQNVL